MNGTHRNANTACCLARSRAANRQVDDLATGRFRHLHPGQAGIDASESIVRSGAVKTCCNHHITSQRFYCRVIDGGTDVVIDMCGTDCCTERSFARPGKPAGDDDHG